MGQSIEKLPHQIQVVMRYQQVHKFSELGNTSPNMYVQLIYFAISCSALKYLMRMSATIWIKRLLKYNSKDQGTAR
jgi:hypothetical protein